MSKTIHKQAEFHSKDGFIGYIITLFYNKRLLSTIITISIVMIGVLFARGIQREAMPNVQSNTFRVTISYPGASPIQVEQDAVIPVEDVIKEIADIKSYTSSSSQGYGTIYINMSEDASDPDAVGDEIYRKINLNSISGISSDIDSITVKRFGTSDQEIYGIVLFAEEGIDELLFQQTANSLAIQIENLPGVGEVRKDGYHEQQIEINVSPRLLARNHVDINSVVNAIKKRNVRSSAGILEDPDNYKAIVTISEYENLEELRNTVIRAGFDRNQILLRDVARVNKVFPEPTSYQRANAKPAIVLYINKTSASDIVKTTQTVKAFLEKNAENFLPQGITWFEFFDEGDEVNKVSRVLITNGVIGFLLILLVLFLFLDFTTAFWTACGLPITMILTLAYMGRTGLSINYLTLTAMITMIGMLVDHGIVISETIFARRAKGFSPLRACIEGLRSVFWPVLVTVSTTIMAFLPMLMVGGMMGKFTRFFPIMVTIMLSFSFFEACFLLVSHLLHAKSNDESPRRLRKEERNLVKGRLPQDTWFSPTIHVYQCMLRFVIRFRWLSLIFFASFLVGGVFYSLPAIKNFVLFDNADSPIIAINYFPHQDTTLEQGRDDSLELEQRIKDITPEGQIKGMTNKVYRDSRGTVKGQMYLRMVSKEDRVLDYATYGKLLSANLLPYGERSRKQLIEMAKKEEVQSNPYQLSNTELERIPVLFENVRLGWEGGGGPGGKAISFRIYGKNNEELRLAGEESVTLLENMAGTMNIESSYDTPTEQIRVSINYQQMARFGIQLSDVNQTLRTAFQGTTASQNRSGDKTSYIVRLEKSYRKSIRTILSLTVQASTGQFIPLSRFARLTTEFTTPSIQHFNGNRTITLTGDLDPNTEGITSLLISNQFKKQFAAIREKYPSVTLETSGGEAEQTNNFVGDIVPAFAVALLLISLILILLFDSFIQPMIVMGSIPFGLVGGLIALQLHGLPAGFMAVLGFMGLIGVVVNDSVVMVEFINNIVRRYPRTKSKLLEPMVLKGAGRRLRAVVLTTLTTVLGLFPTIYGLGGDPGFVRPVVLVLGYGLLAATLITLFFIPAVYMMQLDLAYLADRLRNKLVSLFKSKKKAENLLSYPQDIDNYDLPPDPWV